MAMPNRRQAVSRMLTAAGLTAAGLVAPAAAKPPPCPPTDDGDRRDPAAEDLYGEPLTPAELGRQEASRAAVVAAYRDVQDAADSVAAEHDGADCPLVEAAAHIGHYIDMEAQLLEGCAAIWPAATGPRCAALGPAVCRAGLALHQAARTLESVLDALDDMPETEFADDCRRGLWLVEVFHQAWALECDDVTANECPACHRELRTEALKAAD